MAPDNFCAKALLVDSATASRSASGKEIPVILRDSHRHNLLLAGNLFLASLKLSFSAGFLGGQGAELRREDVQKILLANHLPVDPPYHSGLRRLRLRQGGAQE